jgi:hypothetical protein
MIWVFSYAKRIEMRSTWWGGGTIEVVNRRRLFRLSKNTTHLLIEAGKKTNAMSVTRTLKHGRRLLPSAAVVSAVYFSLPLSAFLCCFSCVQNQHDLSVTLYICPAFTFERFLNLLAREIFQATRPRLVIKLAFACSGAQTACRVAPEEVAAVLLALEPLRFDSQPIRKNSSRK